MKCFHYTIPCIAGMLVTIILYYTVVLLGTDNANILISLIWYCHRDVWIWLAISKWDIWIKTNNILTYLMFTILEFVTNMKTEIVESNIEYALRPALLSSGRVILLVIRQMASSVIFHSNVRLLQHEVTE